MHCEMLPSWNAVTRVKAWLSGRWSCESVALVLERCVHECGRSACGRGQKPLQRKLSGVMVARYREWVRESRLRICVYACGGRMAMVSPGHL